LRCGTTRGRPWRPLQVGRLIRAREGEEPPLLAASRSPPGSRSVSKRLAGARGAGPPKQRAPREREILTYWSRPLGLRRPRVGHHGRFGRAPSHEHVRPARPAEGAGDHRRFPRAAASPAVGPGSRKAPSFRSSDPSRSPPSETESALVGSPARTGVPDRRRGPDRRNEPTRTRRGIRDGVVRRSGARSGHAEAPPEPAST
jgi:hypothetical protein